MSLSISTSRNVGVWGGGAVYAIDGAGLPHSNIAEGEEDTPLSIYHVRLHVLSEGDRFGLCQRRPGELSVEEAQQLQVRVTASGE